MLASTTDSVQQGNPPEARVPEEQPCEQQMQPQSHAAPPHQPEPEPQQQQQPGRSDRRRAALVRPEVVCSAPVLNIDPQRVSRTADGSWELLLKRGESFCVVGSTDLRVAAGAVRVLGFLATPSSGALCVHSPGRVPLALLSVECASEDGARVELSRCQDSDLTEGGSSAIRRDRPWPVSWSGCVALVDTADGTEPRPPVAGAAPLRILDEWAAAADALLERHRAPVILVCGPRGSGKSTFGRYLVNRLLGLHARVAHLETDLGQPELGPPGLLSLCVVSRPLLGPPYTHLHDPLWAQYVGSTTLRDDPEVLLAEVARLARLYRERLHCSAGASGVPELVPLVVNTHGWVKGSGLRMLEGVVRCVQPDAVFELAAAGGAPHESAAKERITLLPAYQAPAGAPPAVGSSTWRSLALVHYMSRAVVPRRPLSELNAALLAAVPVAMSWDSVCVCVVSGDVRASDALLAINGTMVGLCCSPRIAPASPRRDAAAPRQPQVRVAPEAARWGANCVGMGVVWGVDVGAGLFFIFTPVQTARLASVNLLVRAAGGTDLPEWVYSPPAGAVCAPYSGSTVPIRSGATQVQGTSSMKSRNTIKRKRLENANG